MTATMTKTQRAKCRICNYSVKLRKDGSYCNHRGCKGGGLFPSKKKTATATKVAILLDKSSSMFSIRDATMKAFNNITAPLRSTDYKVSYYTFSDQVQLEWENRAASSLPRLKDYRPSGMTALNRALSDAIKGLRDDGSSSYLVICLTDGYENASHGITNKMVGDLITKCIATDRWTFTIACPDPNAIQLPIPPGNITKWDDVTSVGVRTSRGVSEYVKARSSGKTRVDKFYVDVGNQAVAPKVQLHGIRKLTVKRAGSIKDAVIAHKLTYVAGSCYYELLKKEFVSAKKQVILEHRKTGKYYDGRTVLNVYEDKHFEPGNLGEWRVWVQSTSYNRKLLAKMSLLYRA